MGKWRVKSRAERRSLRLGYQDSGRVYRIILLKNFTAPRQLNPVAADYSANKRAASFWAISKLGAIRLARSRAAADSDVRPAASNAPASKT